MAASSPPPPRAPSIPRGPTATPGASQRGPGGGLRLQPPALGDGAPGPRQRGEAEGKRRQEGPGEDCGGRGAAALLPPLLLFLLSPSAGAEVQGCGWGGWVGGGEPRPSHLKTQSSLASLAGETSPCFLLKSFWNRVGGILGPLPPGRRRRRHRHRPLLLLPPTPPNAAAAAELRRAPSPPGAWFRPPASIRCHSHMTAISHPPRPTGAGRGRSRGPRARQRPARRGERGAPG